MESENKKRKNQYAFPNIASHEKGGMFLRDYIAAKAMQSLIGSKEQMEKLSGLSMQDIDKTVSITSYRLADAMLRQRENEN